MKILIISHEYPPIGGGGANACMYLSGEYAKAGHDVDIVTVWYEGLKERESLDDYSGNISIYRVKSRRKKKESCGFAEMMDFIFKALPVSERLVKEHIDSGSKYDVCQIFFGIPSGPVGMYLKKKYGLPYVIRFGGGDIPGFQERFKIVYKLIAPAVRLIWKNADALIANSSGLRDLARGFCDKYPVDVIYNGVDTDVFFPAFTLSGETQDHITLIFISRLIERKGLQFIIPHLKEIADASEKRIRFLIVGDGPFRGRLKELALEAGVSDLIEFVGQKEKNELLEYYQKGDVFVFPSLKEGMPNAVLEAMACGLPVVMSPCQGSEELIDRNGIIADPEPGDFYKSVIRMVSLSDDNRRKMGAVSRQRAEELFSWKKVAEQYLRIFETVHR